MSNEELAVMIQAGERERLPELWANVRRLVHELAYRRWRATGGRSGADVEDLEQAGFLAVLEAVRTFDPEAGVKFTSWLSFPLKTAFSEALGVRSAKQSRNPLHRAHSLDAPLTDDTGDPFTLADVIPDPAAAEALEAVAERDRLAALGRALEGALSALPMDQEAAVRRRYYQGQPVDNKAHNAALRALRHPRVSRSLRVFL